MVTPGDCTYPVSRGNQTIRAMFHVEDHQCNTGVQVGFCIVSPGSLLSYSLADETWNQAGLPVGTAFLMPGELIGQ